MIDTGHAATVWLRDHARCRDLRGEAWSHAGEGGMGKQLFPIDVEILHHFHTTGHTPARLRVSSPHPPPPRVEFLPGIWLQGATFICMSLQIRDHPVRVQEGGMNEMTIPHRGEDLPKVQSR